MYLVVFRNRKRADIDAEAYSVEAEMMEHMAREQPGFLSFKSYSAEDGEVVAISEWETEEAAHNWGSVAQHRQVQSRGRELYYESYTLFGCDAPHIHQFAAKDRS